MRFLYSPWLRLFCILHVQPTFHDSKNAYGEISSYQLRVGTIIHHIFHKWQIFSQTCWSFTNEDTITTNKGADPILILFFERNFHYFLLNKFFFLVEFNQLNTIEMKVYCVFRSYPLCFIRFMCNQCYTYATPMAIWLVNHWLLQKTLSCT